VHWARRRGGRYHTGALCAVVGMTFLSAAVPVSHSVAAAGGGRRAGPLLGIWRREGAATGWRVTSVTGRSLMTFEGVRTVVTNDMTALGWRVKRL
jgi:hypothetical protein